MEVVSPLISITTLNVNVLNSLIKRHRVIEWIKNAPTICCPQEMHLGNKDKFKVKGYNMILQANGVQRKVDVATGTLDKIDFTTKKGNETKMDAL